MKRAFTLVLFFIANLSFAQNLIPNPSFEQYDTCPNYLGQVNYSIGWSTYSQSPDYFNSCAPFVQFPSVSVSVPSNYWGYAYAKTGNAYIGLVSFSKIGRNVREFIGTQLEQVLTVGQKYFASFYVRRAGNNFNNLNIASNKLGMRFSTVSYSDTNPAPINNFAHVYTDSVVTDSSNWTKIAGSFVADFAYQYVSFGNFFTDSTTSIIELDSTASYAYYYFDEIRLSTDSNYVNSINEHNSLNLAKVFPNPARDWIVVEGTGICKLSIYNILGNVCFSNTVLPTSLVNINVSNFCKGIYFLSIETETENINEKLIIQ